MVKKKSKSTSSGTSSVSPPKKTRKKRPIPVTKAVAPGLDSKGVDRRTTAQRKRAQMQQDLRDKFKASEYIRQLEISAKKLDELLVSLKVANQRKMKLTRKDREELIATRAQISSIKISVDIIKTSMDLNFKRLKFCIPELKSVELVDPTGENPFSNFVEALKVSMQNAK